MTHPIEPVPSATPFKDAFNNVKYPTPVMVSFEETLPLFERADAEIAALRSELAEAQADVARLRARTRVEAEDVERVVTREQVVTWARRSGIAYDDDYGDAWRTAATLLIAMHADDYSGQWRILDEMTAMSPETNR
jgi:hypothetical protein